MKQDFLSNYEGPFLMSLYKNLMTVNGILYFGGALFDLCIYFEFAFKAQFGLATRKCLVATGVHLVVAAGVSTVLGPRSLRLLMTICQKVRESTVYLALPASSSPAP